VRVRDNPFHDTSPTQRAGLFDFPADLVFELAVAPDESNAVFHHNSPAAAPMTTAFAFPPVNASEVADVTLSANHVIPILWKICSGNR
jgi:hypothetical protein